MKIREVAVEFGSEGDSKAALEILFKNEVPYVLVGGRTVIVAREKTRLFDHLKHKVTAVLSAADLPSEEITRLRRENLRFPRDE